MRASEYYFPSLKVAKQPSPKREKKEQLLNFIAKLIFPSCAFGMVNKVRHYKTD